MEIWIVVAVIVVVAVVVVGIYNGLIGRRNRVDEALSQIQVQLEPDPLQAIEARVERARERLELLRVIEARLLSAVERLRRVR